MNQPIMWYASRATGLIALVLFTTSVVFGVLESGRFSGARWPRFAIAAVHRNVSLLSVAFLAVHIGTSIIDPFAGIGWLDAIVPFGSIYHPFWLGLGAVATDLTVAIVVTSLLRPKVRLRLWKAVHWTSYACWPLAVIHGIGTGPADFQLGWVVAVNIACVVAVVIALGWRVGVSHPDTEARARASGRRPV
ncbi:MAG TPA: ferric reductase-like transmembrane domain-containing protein [Pseudonocardiaceae bacterium]|nr:ferric reductase-like transmembrane domain-containing protein [Pseudonocardiaceae bacterium]